MAKIKTTKEIEILRQGGKRLAQILDQVSKIAKPGISTKELDDLARDLILKGGDRPAFLNYTPAGASRPFPATLCVSINEEVIHGIPNENPKILKEGDVVSIDLGLCHEGLYTDSAITIGVGEIDSHAKKLIDTTKEALYVGIGKARSGIRVNDIGKAIEKFVKPYKFSLAKELGGHGVGHKVHEEPFVPNYAIRGSSIRLVPGMVIAIEPMLNEGTGNTRELADGYTFVTADGKRSAHFEHTILITEGEAEILTQ